MAFGRTWVKRHKLETLERFALEGRKRLEEACQNLQEDYGPRIEAEGYGLTCKPAETAPFIMAVIHQPDNPEVPPLSDDARHGKVETSFPEEHKGFHVTVCVPARVYPGINLQYFKNKVR